jgi:hypothetical protein
VGLVALGAAFVLVHLVLGVVDVVDTAHQPAGDVTGVYRFWIDYWHQTGVLVGITTPWVYPIAALPPMIAADAFGDDGYLVTWLVMVTLLDAVALVLLARRSRALAWFPIACTALLGPVALVRIDAVALPIAILGVLAVATRPAVASALLTLAAWVKVWPAALVAAVLLTGRRTAAVVAAAALTSAGVIGLAVAFGARSSVFSFVTAQADRGLQIEAPVALPWLWSAAFGDGGVQIYYDTNLLTFQVRADGVAVVADLMTPVLVVGVLVIVAFALVARLRGGEPAEVLALTALALVAAVIALNKVGSPQYATWYVAPVLLGLLVSGRRFRVPAVLVLLITGLTQLVYPWLYGGVTGTQPIALAVLTVRDLLEVVLLGWALVALGGTRAPAPPALRRTSAYAVEQ